MQGRPPPFTRSREPSVPPGKPIKASIVYAEEKTHFRKSSVLCAWCGKPSVCLLPTPPNWAYKGQAHVQTVPLPQLAG